jgi:transcriptional regulator with GAF, ATPase, and Fis domain
VRLQEVTTAISAESFDLDHVLNLIVDRLLDIFRGASCAIRLYRLSTNQFGDRVAAGRLEEQIDYPPRANGTTQHVLATQMPFYTEHTTARLPNGEFAIREQVQGAGIGAAACLPLISEQNVIGILYVDWSQPGGRGTQKCRAL